MYALKHFPRKLLLLLVVALVFVPSGAALTSQTYPDTTGDAPTGAPDITGVTISHSFAGKITFSVAFANRSQLGGDDLVFIAIDRDQSPLTGIGSRGADYSIAVDGDYFPMLAVIANLNDPNQQFFLTAFVEWSGNTMTFTVNKGDIGAPTAAFDFAVASTGAMSATNPSFELVPHSGELTYSLAVAISQIQPPKTVTSVRAGSLFSVKGATVRLSTDEVFTPDTLTAKATIGGNVIKPAAGGLAWKIPKMLKGKKTVGKKLVVTMNASYQGMQGTQKLTLPIR